MKWIRLYPELLNDPKVQQLPKPTAWFWINLLALAGELESAGLLPPLEEIAFRLRMTKPRVTKMLACLQEARLVDVDGDTLTMHNWASRQPISDRSRDRMRASRARHGDALEQNREEQTREEENRTEQSGDGSDPAGRADKPPSLEQAEQAFLDADPKDQVARLIDLGDVHGFNRSKGLTASLVADWGHDPPGVIGAMRVTADKKRNKKDPLQGSPWKYAKGVMANGAPKTRRKGTGRRAGAATTTGGDKEAIEREW